MDHYETPLNACSLESLQKPIQTSKGSAWPIITSCYNLEKDGSRTGHLDLFLVQVPQNDADPLQFGDPHLSFGCRSGILDGKWFPKNASNVEGWWFATAQSSGDIGLHTFILGNDPGKEPLIAGQTSSSTPVTSDTGAPNLCLAVNWDNTRSFNDARIVSSYSNGKVAVHDVARCEDDGIPELIERD